MIKELLGLASKNPVIGPWVAPVQALWPLLWRLAIALVIFGFGWHFGGKNAEQKLAQQNADLLRAHIDAVDALRAEERRMDEKSNEIEESYEAAKTELAAIRKRIPTRVVRVCNENTNHSGVSVPRRSGESEGTTSGENLSGTIGRDIGPALYGLADECDDLATRLLSLQKWVTAMAEDKE